MTSLFDPEHIASVAAGCKGVANPDELLTVYNGLANECTKCSFHADRRQVVWADGNASCSLMLVGEAPGENEDIRGIPFVGRAGQLLDRILAAPLVEIPREEVYINNILKCRPPNNRTPSKKEMDNCKPFLEKQIELVKPVLIIAMGNPAGYALLNRGTRITYEHGQEFAYKNIPVIRTYHTAYLLRNEEAKPYAYKDWQLIAKLWRQLRR